MLKSRGSSAVKLITSVNEIPKRKAKRFSAGRTYTLTFVNVCDIPPSSESKAARRGLEISWVCRPKPCLGTLGTEGPSECENTPPEPEPNLVSGVRTDIAYS